MTDGRPRILLIDDDRKLAELLKGYLAGFKMSVTAAATADEGLRALTRHPADLVILDVMLPGKDGFEVCKEIRKTAKTPIIMLTARGEVTDRVVGLELGADDYVPKPFEPRELVARIHSVLRRPKPAAEPQGTLTAGALQVDLDRRTAALSGRILPLTTSEFAILAFFMQRPGAVLDRDRILEHLKGIEADAFNRTVDVTVSRLRKKLKDASARVPKYIKTVWGEGYLFIGKVTTGHA